jgi:NAD+ synthase (glutamine-hydrolysing)
MRSAPDKVRALMLPSRYNAVDQPRGCARDGRMVGVRYDEIAIEPMFKSFLDTLADEFKGRPVDATERTSRRASAACC